ncbi:hypothetical protein MTO96_014297 [Rhipicephalus appendiculatus]
MPLYYITGLDMGYYYFGGFDTDVQGIAFLGGVCTIDKLGMGEDRKDTYSGVRITAHELGHLLGCPHDGEQYRFFSSKNCSDSYGFIMTYWSNTSRSMKFSPCCNQAISELARSWTPSFFLVKNWIETKVCQLAFPTLEDIRFVTDNGVARCRASCYSTKANKTFWTILPDHSPCNETIVKGKQYPNMVCVNGDCRPKLSKPSQYPVKPCISLTC